MTWYAQSGPRSQDTGKFRARSLTGVEKQAGGEYRGWTYSFVTRQTGSSVKRTYYSVSIKDINGHQAAYLRDFSSVEQAVKSAQEWIDRTFKFKPPTTQPGVVGSIPSFPDAAVQEK